MSHQTVEHARVTEHGHPTSRTYIIVAVILAIITSVEVALFYIELPRTLLIFLLLAFSAAKFVLVAAMFMHLRFDAPLFTYFFGGGLILAAALMIGLMLLVPNPLAYNPPPFQGGATTEQESHDGGEAGGAGEAQTEGQQTGH
jgi:cytochrome c oxidase subunit IV